MVLGLRSRHRKGASVGVDYLVHVGEINPWSTSQSLKSVQSVLLQWENGSQNSGSITSSIGDTSIEFNVVFTLPVTLCREKKSQDKFQKNLLEFSLFEHRKDRVARGQLLGTATVNLADYGIIDDIVSINAPVSWKKSSRNKLQPVLFIKIQQVDNNSSNSTPKISLSKEVSLDKDGQDFVSGLKNKENDDESEIASFTDDDVSSQSSRTFASSAFETAESPSRSDKVVSDLATENTGRGKPEAALPLVVESLTPTRDRGTETSNHPSEASNTLFSKDLIPDLGKPENRHASESRIAERNITSMKKECDPPIVQSSLSFLQYQDSSSDSINSIESFEDRKPRDNHGEYVSGSTRKINTSTLQLARENVDLSAATARVGTSNACMEGQSNKNTDDVLQQKKLGQGEAPTITDLYVDGRDDMEKMAQQETEKGPLVVEYLTPTLDLETDASKYPSGASDTLFTKDLVPDSVKPENNHASVSKIPKQNITSIVKECDPPVVQSSSSFSQYQDLSRGSINSRESVEEGNTRDNLGKNVYGSTDKIKPNTLRLAGESFNISVATARLGTTNAYADSQSNQSSDDVVQQRNFGQVEATSFTDLYVDQRDDTEKMTQRETLQDDHTLEEKKHTSENNGASKVSQNGTRKQSMLRSTTLTSSGKVVGVQGISFTNSKLKQVKSVQLPLEAANANVQNNKKVNRTGSLNDGHSKLTSTAASGREETTNISDMKNEWRSRAEMLEEELREAAALEVGLYSVVAEHASSTNKVHAPARRLSRFYLHAYGVGSKDKRANTARAAVSGLILVCKACGNDVPRLTFWLSNSIMLRAIVSKTVGELPLCNETCITSSFVQNGSDRKGKSTEEIDSWADPETFSIALKNVETWIFSRIVESVWWQTLTPHMQSAAAKSSRTMSSSSRKTNGVLQDQEQGNISIELWKKAFKDACERLCPIRAGGHECGCLPVLARLVMEPLVSRLDVAMFNAILRESAEEMPTDPVSDPIADSKVLPVPSGRSSFGAGAQLKNAVGTWSRWLTDIFGIEENDSYEDNDKLGNLKQVETGASFKPFQLLNSLSDLMMLPFEMLADVTTRKEVCPTFSAPLIKRVFSNFVPDEFCPEPIPSSVINSLDSEDAPESADESFTVFPFNANPTVYKPPAAASLSSIIGDIGSHDLRRSGSSLLRKAYASDDELDELDSPLTSILSENLRNSQSLTKSNELLKYKGGRNVVRYQLLREVWRDGQ